MPPGTLLIGKDKAIKGLRKKGEKTVVVHVTAVLCNLARELHCGFDP